MCNNVNINMCNNVNINMYNNLNMCKNVIMSYSMDLRINKIK